MRAETMLIEGYASVFGRVDLGGDVVRAGAFARSLARRPETALLIGHRETARAGRSVRLAEDGYGLFVRGLIESEGGRAFLKSGARGLSIGFYARLWTPRPGGGRELIEVDLAEISLVSAPMQPLARFEVVGAGTVRAA